MKIEQLQESEGELFLYHGGKDLQNNYREFRPAGKGRWEAGPGIYFTTHYETAQSYAKGSKSVFRGYIRCPIRWLQKSKSHVNDMVYFVNTWVPKSKRPRIIESIYDNVDRHNSEMISTEILVNLCINDEALNKSGTVALREWLIEEGVDASYQRGMKNEEFWVVVINPRVIKRVEKTVPSDVPVEEYVISFNPKMC